MGKCILCGIEGPFVRIDSDGRCPLCQKKSGESGFRKQTVRARDLNPEQVLHRYLSTDHRTYPSVYDVVSYYTAEFDCLLSSLPERVIGRAFCDAPAGKPECVYRRKFDGCEISETADFIAIDTETGGLDARAEVIEVSAIRFCSFRPRETFATLCRPYRPISAAATAVNGITNRQVANAPRFAEILSELNCFCGDLPLVAHNAVFDLNVLAREGFPTHGRVVYDTLPLARSYLRDLQGNRLKSYKLSESCKACAILFAGAHRSTADAFAAGLLFLELIKRGFGISDLAVF